MIRYLVFVVLCFCSCKGFDSFLIHDRLQQKVKSKYGNEVLYIEDYMFCNFKRQRTLMKNVFEERNTNSDSLIGLFSEKFEKTGLNIFYSAGGVNLADSSICHKEVLRINHLSKMDFSALGINSSSRKILIPVIKIADIYSFTGYMTSNMVAGDAGFMNFTSLSLLVYIIEDNEVIYTSNHRYASKRTFANSLEEVRAIPPAYQVREEHIEELVRRAMKRYVKRLER